MSSNILIRSFIGFHFDSLVTTKKFLLPNKSIRKNVAIGTLFVHVSTFFFCSQISKTMKNDLYEQKICYSTYCNLISDPGRGLLNRIWCSSPRVPTPGGPQNFRKVKEKNRKNRKKEKAKKKEKISTNLILLSCLKSHFFYF